MFSYFFPMAKTDFFWPKRSNGPKWPNDPKWPKGPPLNMPPSETDLVGFSRSFAVSGPKRTVRALQ